MQINTVLWDWNGTLLDDLDAAVAGMNELLALHGRPLTNREEYRAMIDIPVENYYRKLFDFRQTPFEELAAGFIQGYDRRIPSAGLMPGAEETLRRLQEMGMRQIIVSSFHERTLLAYLERFGIASYFDAVSGAGDFISEGKTQRARALLQQLGVSPANTLAVGDMVHDFDTAQSLGAHCVLIPNGQQSAEKLRTTGARIATSLFQIPLYIAAVNNGSIC